MLAFVAATLALAATTSASPVAAKRQLSFPPTSTSKAFSLVANVTWPEDEARVFPQHRVHLWHVRGYHVGAGIDDATLYPVPAGSGINTAFYQNKVGAQATLHRDIAGASFPWSFTIQGMTETSDYVRRVGVDAAFTPTPGTEINAGGVPRVNYEPANHGSFIVCNETEPNYYTPQYSVYATKRGVPDNCVSINLLAQCAELQSDGGEQFGHEVADVECYEDVGAIDWTQYQIYE